MVLLSGCSASPLPDPVGEPVAVELLDPGFVRYEGRRVPVETFHYDMRRRVRAAEGDATRAPAIRVRVGDGVDGPGALDAFLLELERSGVKSVTIG